MVVPTENIEKFCRAVSKDIAALYDGLNMYFVIHKKSKLRDAIAITDHNLTYHPASDTAQQILRKQPKGDESDFLGFAISRKSTLWGFKKTEKILALFVINSDEFESIEGAKEKILNLVWHAIDLYDIRQRPAYKNKFAKGAMIPKRSPINLGKSYLQADAFTAIIQACDGERNSARKLGYKRAKQSLSPITHFKSENHPFVIAMEACEFAIEDLLKTNIAGKNKYLLARKISLDIGHAFDETSIKQWWKFALPAQDMAWRGSSPEEILGAALNTSDSPFVRSIAFLIDEILNITPLSADDVKDIYNSYLDSEKVFDLHRDMVDSAFENAIAEGLKDSSPEAFMKAANQQNESLTNGHILGWCANALQNAGTAFENALKSGTAPDQAARVNFKTMEVGPNWQDLKELGSKIIDEKRNGFAITMGNIAEICHDNQAFKGVFDSIKITMNDPSYLQKLQAANDLNYAPSGPALSGPELSGPTPKDPAPKGPAPKTPEISTPLPMPAPGLGGPGGGNNRNAQIMHQRRLQAEKQKQDKENSHSSNSEDKK